MAPRSYVHATPEQWQKLAAAVRRRRTDLDITQATAVERSGGMISTAVWSVLEGARQQRGRMEERSLRGADKALEWPRGEALAILTGRPDPGAEDALAAESEVTGIAAKAGRLSPEKRDRLIGYLDALLDEPEDD